MREGSQTWQALACCKGRRRAPTESRSSFTHAQADWGSPSFIKRSPRQRLGALRTAAARRWRDFSPSLSPPPAGCIGLQLPHFGDAGLHLLRSVEKSARVNLSKAFQDAALEAVLRALFSIPESGDSETLSHMARAYIEGPGRPTLLDGFSKSESSFALANFRRARFQNHWRPVIDQFVLRRKASPTSAGHRDLLDLLNIRDAETGGRYRTPTSATNARPCFSRASRSWGKTSR